MTLFDRSYKQPHRSVSHSPLKSYYVFVKAQNKLLNQQDISDLISFVFEKILSFPFPFFRFLSQISMNVLIFFAPSLRDSGLFLFSSLGGKIDARLSTVRNMNRVV